MPEGLNSIPPSYISRGLRQRAQCLRETAVVSSTQLCRRQHAEAKSTNSSHALQGKDAAMGGPSLAGKASSPRLPLNAPSEGSPMDTTGSGNSTPYRLSAASQTPGSSRFAVAYRVLKQWVEDLLVSDLNPTLTIVSRPSSASAGISKENKGDRKAVAPERSRSSCGATPLSTTHSRETTGPPIAYPGLLSDSSCHCNHNIPWQTSPSHLSPQWPPSGSHLIEEKHDLNCECPPPQRPMTNAAQELTWSAKLNDLSEDASKGQELIITTECNSDPKQPIQPRPDIMPSRTLPQATADGPLGFEVAKPRNQQTSRTLSLEHKENAVNAHKAVRTEMPVDGPREQNCFLQYSSFRVRWGEVRTEPSPAVRMRVLSLCDSATECELSSSLEPRDASSRRTQQPSDRQIPACDVALTNTGGNCATSTGCTRSQGLQNTDSLLWRMKDRLSSTFWSKTSGGSRTHMSRESPDYPAPVSGVVDNHVYPQESFPHGNDPQFHRHLALVFKDLEVERAYGEFLRRARVKRLVVVGVLTILLNTMYDMPEWIITLTSPMLTSGEGVGQTQALNHLTAFSQSPGSSLTWRLVFMDVFEVLLQVILAASGYLPILKYHTERATVAIMLCTSLLSSVRPAAILLLPAHKQNSNETYREELLTPVQTIMTSTFLRSIVGSVLIDLVCLVRRRKLCHFHKLLSLLLLGLLVACTIGGVQLGFPYSFFVFSWTVGLATGIVIASCYAGAYMSELMHRKAFHSVSTISAKLQKIQEENKSQRATGKNMLEQLVGFLKQMGLSISAIDPENLEQPMRDTLLQVSALQAKCLGVLTSGRDMYAVNWLSPEVPPEMQVLYKKFIEPYVRQDSILARYHDVQTVTAFNASHERSHGDASSPTGAAAQGPAVPCQLEQTQGETHAGVGAFQPVAVTVLEGIRIPEVESGCLALNIGVGDAIGGAVSNSAGTPSANPTASREFSSAAPGTLLHQSNSPDGDPKNVTPSEALQIINSQIAVRRTAANQAKQLTPEDETVRAGSSLRAETESETEAMQGKRAAEAALPLWATFSAETEGAFEEYLRSPLLSGFTGSIGTEWTIDMFALDQATNANCLVVVGLQLLLPHVRNGGLTCTTAALHAFLKSMQDQYLPNLYHNRLHGAMVAHLSVFLARMAGLSRTFQLRLGSQTDVVSANTPSIHAFVRGNTLSCKQVHSRDGRLLIPSSSSVAHFEAQTASRKGLDDEVFMCIAALGHDVGHPGFNNAFLVSTNQSLAMVYNDNAVLENYHAYLTFKTISATAAVDGGILKGLSAGAYRQLRKQVIDLILATDMAQHFPTLSSFRARNASQTFSVSGNEEDRWMLAKLLIKAGDVGHSMLAWEQHYIWACRVNDEFYKQGDVEEQLGIAISPLCDRRKEAEMPAAQCGFLEYIVLPLATEIRSCLESQVTASLPHSAGSAVDPNSAALHLMDGIIAHANYNLRCWKSMAASASPQKQQSADSTEPLPADKDCEIRKQNENERTSPTEMEGHV